MKKYNQYIINEFNAKLGKDNHLYVVNIIKKFEWWNDFL